MSPWEKWLAELLDVIEDVSKRTVGTDVKIAHLREGFNSLLDSESEPKSETGSETAVG